MENKELVDISGITIERSLNKEERMKWFVEKVGNPYEFRVGDIEVAVTFEADGGRMQDKMEHYFESMMVTVQP